VNRASFTKTRAHTPVSSTPTLCLPLAPPNDPRYLSAKLWDV